MIPMILGVLGAALMQAQAQSATPVIVMDGILNAEHDDSPAFSPDGKTFYFDRTIGHDKSIMASHWESGHWSTPVTVPFSGRWLDQDPAVSPDGSYLVFSSNRPVPGGDSVVFEQDGKKYRGANLWRVDRQGDGWGTPIWLGPGVNGSNLVVAPSVAANGAVYFIQHLGGAMHIYRSEFRNGAYLPATRVALGDSTQPTHDPAIAPDESFLVFDYGKGDGNLGRLSIALREGDHWSAPQDLGDEINKDAPWGAHLSPDHRTVYVTGNTHIWSLSLEPKKP
ncbi:MAG TPA: hypothetical protein VI159_03115 [Gemmatimonadales bacterium]